MKNRIPVKSALLILLILLSVFAIAVVAVIDQRVTSKLDGVLWTVPAKIYSRSLEIPKIINIDYAYYNPVSLLMKDRGSLEKAFKKDNIKISIDTRSSIVAEF